MMASSESEITSITPRQKRSRTEVRVKEPDSNGAEASSPTKCSAKKRKKEFIVPNWADIPEWKTDRSPLMEMPVEILDKVCFTNVLSAL